MASQDTAHLPNWLDGDAIPFELKTMILEHTSSHRDLVSLLKAYPIWVNESWAQYPMQLFQPAYDNVLRDIDPDLEAEVLIVYHIRKIRKDYATSMGSSVETQLHRNRLQDDLRDILSLDDNPLPDLERNLQTILDVAEVVRDVNSLTYRYSNDAWNRIYDIAKIHGWIRGSFADAGTSPTINLTRIEKFKFNRAFLRVEIYLLTKYWTSAQDQRHILDMGRDIEPFIPPPRIGLADERRQFDSCLRYIFHAYRGYLKKTARGLGAPELPTRDDFQWVSNRNEEREYQYKDYPTLDPGIPERDFAQRSVSEEQGFLLWLCEFGIGRLEQTHNADDKARRDELLLQFSHRHIWETVELRHRVSRYDVSPDRMFSFDHSVPDIQHRNRHPIKSLYGHDAHQQYSENSSPWACAAAFLTWTFNDPRSMIWVPSREHVTLANDGHWLTMSDTDKGPNAWNAFERKGLPPHSIPYGHPYMLDRRNYQLREFFL